MTLDEALQAIDTADNRNTAMAIANTIAMHAMQGLRPAEDEQAVRAAWLKRWGHEKPVLGDAGPRAGTNWTGD
jgi:hypothetical protein